VNAPTPAPRQTWPEVLEQLHSEKYTGPLLVHFGQGVPSAVVKIGECAQIPLAKRERRG
jgi:hypothetical protein